MPIVILPSSAIIYYSAELKKANCSSFEELQLWFQNELPYLFYESYLRCTLREAQVVTFMYGTFTYMFDECVDIVDKETGVMEKNGEPRLIVAFGHSDPQKKPRDDYRLKGWLGPTEKVKGKNYDKGHFIANSIGGAIDGLEVNVFFQKRGINRGWNNMGEYRKMEKFCMDNLGSLCFNRPIYTGNTAHPKYIEFGIFKSPVELWVKVFEND